MFDTVLDTPLICGNVYTLFILYTFARHIYLIGLKILKYHIEFMQISVHLLLVIANQNSCFNTVVKQFENMWENI